MAYASADDLRRLLRIDSFTDEETATAELLIELAQGVIEDEVGQALEQSTDTVILDGPTDEDPRYHPASGSRKLILPRWPVTAVASVRLVDEDEDLVFGKDRDYTWSASGVLHRRGADWPAHERAIEVVYTPGYAPVPPGPKRICLRLSAAGWSNPEFLSAETLGDHSRSFSAEALGMELTAADRRTLGAYRART
ncbi:MULTISPECIES: hypothetical protein [Streptomyces]|uniref:Mobile element protein n=2 Tax=root TaxID=1 RepID=F2R6A2_STRVP|nr:hypothetical protein [Streptomyces venezuelae]YP_010754221.1 head-to-tail connector protein [Streptomyces phage Chymera]AMS01568.1 head-to-tail connector protein [Streptomyces phage Chymera]APE22039.1 hypothetical protein vnz_14100 [Streptomyces venezuelae]QER99427.1 hypothetical protein DEJ43_14275 [Streptomyces venezuelae ATCC 10712]CCA56153.1 hypothetical protein SVEN_2867 [Streptomyces venezuelae ATCC 10712]